VPNVDTTVSQSPDVAELRREVSSHPLWYHTIELAPGVATPGWFDLRPIVETMPWPDVRGKRCLDVGTYDGFLAFELERRGAAQVVATDISNPSRWDWPLITRERGTQAVADAAGGKTGMGFEIARGALGSSVERVESSVYDLRAEEIGTFDVVVCGSLLLHLRDPVRALEAIRGVCDGVFMSAETVQLALTLLHRRTPGGGAQRRPELPVVDPERRRAPPDDRRRRLSDRGHGRSLRDPVRRRASGERASFGARAPAGAHKARHGTGRRASQRGARQARLSRRRPRQLGLQRRQT
jgi:SAM-dependent methyltransferase